MEVRRVMARKFENGVSWYTHGVISISFPEDEVSCRYCPCLRSDANGARFKCCITGDILANIDLIGHRCPIESMEEDEHD